MALGINTSFFAETLNARKALAEIHQSLVLD
jgi:hypothetical protein